MENNLLKEQDVQQVGGGYYYNLVLNLKEKYNETYEKGFDICGYYNFKAMKDVDTYLERAMEYLAEEYEIDVDCRVYYGKLPSSKQMSVIIFLTDSGETIVDGTITIMEEPTIYKFNENEDDD